MVEMNLCDYGCGQEASHQFKNRKWCCASFHQCCPEVRRKNSDALSGENNPAKRIEIRKKISDSLKGENHPFYGKELTKEHKRKIGKGLKGNKNTLGHILSKDHKIKLSKANKGKKHTKETRRKISKANRGEKHPNWQDGISKLPYSPDWGPKVKQKVLERDNHECQNCGEIENLAVHHIDYNKMKCDSTNLITLCNSCNAKANYKKKYWYLLYERKIENA